MAVAESATISGGRRAEAESRPQAAAPLLDDRPQPDAQAAESGAPAENRPKIEMGDQPGEITGQAPQNGGAEHEEQPPPARGAFARHEVVPKPG